MCSKIIQIACGANFTLALDNEGQIHAFGENIYGQLGHDTTEMCWLPKNISSIQNSSLYGKHFVAITCGFGHSFALDNTGQVYAWGFNLYGQLGNGTTEKCLLPTNISGIKDSSLFDESITSISSGVGHFVALGNDKIHVCGINGYGQLGNNSTESLILPCQISFQKPIVAIACGYFHSLVLDSDGQVHAFGHLGLNRNITTKPLH